MAKGGARSHGENPQGHPIRRQTTCELRRVRRVFVESSGDRGAYQGLTIQMRYHPGRDAGLQCPGIGYCNNVVKPDGAADWKINWTVSFLLA